MLQLPPFKCVHSLLVLSVTYINTYKQTMGIILPVYEFSFAKGATRLLRGASRLAELSLINVQFVHLYIYLIIQRICN